AHEHVVQVGRLGAVEVTEIGLQAAADAFVQRVALWVLLGAHAAMAWRAGVWSGRSPAVRASIQVSNASATARRCASTVVVAFTRARNKATSPRDKGSDWAYQPRCLRALRTPVSSP